ncbi:MAG: hypothetical protein HOQ24_13560 [Mycobacteriaceae bacterium]|nr:hypothetical protein [Mycobacteriaceae bacterium]
MTAPAFLSAPAEFWDTARWQPLALARRCYAWTHASRRRRLLAWSVVVVVLGLVLPAIIGAVATAATGTLAAPSGSAGLSWMNIRDSHGVRVSDYGFSTRGFSVLHPGDTALSIILQLEFSGWLVIVTTAIWLIGYAISFQWLNMFSNALHGTAKALTGQIATPIMMSAAAAIGAFFVGWFVVRGFPAKATMQVITMLSVAILGPMFLSDPLGDVLASDGLLAQGRNLGISVAAGLNGNNNPNPTQMVGTMQKSLADNFARKPLQVWNFGEVVDDKGCAGAWSSGVNAGNAAKIKDKIKGCDSDAHAVADNPSAGQIGTGLILLICGTVLLLFAAYLSIKVIWSALDTIYHGIMVIFGFAAGGFVYGPTQTFLVRNVVDGVVAAGRMAAYTIFLGFYVLFLGNLFNQAKGQVMAVFVIGGLAEIIAIFQLSRLSKGLSRGNDWIANRFALALQGAGGGRGGGGGGTALGMGNMGAGRSAGGLAPIAALAALNTIDSNPITGHLFMSRSPLQYMARRRQQAERINADMAITRWPWEMQRRGELDRVTWDHAARRRHTNSQGGGRGNSGVGTYWGLADALDGITDAGAPNNVLGSILMNQGFSRDMVNAALRVRADAMADTSVNPFQHMPLMKVVAALGNAQARSTSGDAEAYRSWYAIAASNFHSKAAGALDQANVNHGFVQQVRAHWDNPQGLRAAITNEEWNSQHIDTLRYLGWDLAQQNFDIAREYMRNPTVDNLRSANMWAMRAYNIDMITGPLGRGPWSL